MYAVIDLVTAGVGFGVVEIAVVRADRLGRVVDEWCRPVGEDFASVAGPVVALLRGRTVVAHNLAARALALADEFARLGATAPLDGLCTMRLARYFLPAASRGLDACRIAAGLPPHRITGALPDARAAADLLAVYLQTTGTPPPWLPVVDEAACAVWPEFSPHKSEMPGGPTVTERPRTLRTRLIERLPRAAQPADDAYLELLDRALLDHRTDLDPGELRAVARRLGVADIEALHRRYLAVLAVIGRDLDPGDAARPDLTEIAHLLTLPSGSVDNAMNQAAADPGDRWRRLQPGDTVVFGGTLAPSRDRWLSEARAAGLVVGNAVTRKTRLLVTADPEARTGNAEKARRYQVPIVHPAAYREILRRAGPLRRNSRF